MVIKGEVVGGEWVKQIKDIESIFITISSEECTKLQKKNSLSESITILHHSLYILPSYSNWDDYTKKSNKISIPDKACSHSNSVFAGFLKFFHGQSRS